MGYGRSGLGATADIILPTKKRVVEVKPPEVPEPPEVVEPREDRDEVTVEPEDGVASISVSRQRKYILILDFESIDYDEKNRLVHSNIWVGVVDPAIREEYLLLKKAIKAYDSDDKSLFDSSVKRLQVLNPNKYPDSVRVDRDYCVSELKNMNAKLESLEVPCTQIIRRDATGSKTSSVADTKDIELSVFKFTSDDTFRTQMNSTGIGGTLFVDVHFDDGGKCVGFAFLNRADKEKAIKFGDNYISPGVNKEAFRTILNGLGSFMINKVDMLPAILASLDGRGMTSEKSSGEKLELETEDTSKREHLERSRPTVDFANIR